jgi:hypothetical protein
MISTQLEVCLMSVDYFTFRGERGERRGGVRVGVALHNIFISVWIVEVLR